MKTPSQPTASGVPLDSADVRIVQMLEKRIQSFQPKYGATLPSDLTEAIRNLQVYVLEESPSTHACENDSGEYESGACDPADSDQGTEPHARLVPAEAMTQPKDMAATVFMAAKSLLAASGPQKGRSCPAPVTDRVSLAVTKCPVPYTGEEPSLDFGRQGLLGQRHIQPSQLHHALVLGETGAGKTVSSILSALHAGVGYACDGLASSMLVIDPKKDLLAVLKQEAQRAGRGSDLRVVGQRHGAQPLRIQYFGGDLQALSVRERYFKIAELVPECRPTGEDGDRWMQKGHELSVALLSLDTAMNRLTGCSLLAGTVRLLGWRDGPMTQWEALDGLYQWVSSMAHLRAICLLWDAVLHLSGQAKGAFNPLSRLASMNQEGFNQWLYESRMARMVSANAGSPCAAQMLDLDMLDSADSRALAWSDLLEQGALLVFQPEHSSEQNFCARALKAGFFQACLTRRQLQRPVFYVADEFQRFVTTEGESSEVHFLDRCRAYRVNCILATQSYASLLTEYGQEAALDCLVNNIPTVLVFRTKDTKARRLIEEAFNPPQVGLSHVLDVRPISQLRTGEYYYVSPVQRGRIQAPRPAH